jgi:hypothetical protein
VLVECFQPQLTSPPTIALSAQKTRPPTALLKMGKKEATSSIYSFQEARRIARGHGFDSQDEYIDYSCPGAYQLPKNPQEIFQNEWKGWDDFLGITYANFEEARDVARTLKQTSKEDYLNLFQDKRIDDLPFGFPIDLMIYCTRQNGKVGMTG